MRQSQASSPDKLSTGSLVTEELLASSFMICGISNNLDGTEDVLIREAYQASLKRKKMTATLMIPSGFGRRGH